MNLKLGDTQLIIAECKKQGLLRNEVAYVLATAYHESAHTMKPITEMGSQAYLRGKKYWPYIGRGYVQLTWDYNYKKASDKLSVDFVKDPGSLLLAKYSVPILVIGMKEGWFTGKKLSNYITLTNSDFINARRIINGTDKADLIAGYAKSYDTDLITAKYGVEDTQSPVQSVSVVPSVIVPEVTVAPVAPSKGPGIVSIILDLVMVLFNGKAGR